MQQPSGGMQSQYTQNRNLAIQTGMEGRFDQISFGNLIMVMFGFSIVLFVIVTFIIGKLTNLEGMQSFTYTAIGIGVINVIVFGIRIVKSIKRRLEIRRLRR